MEPEGMVHALKKIHQLLKPGGVMIDIHPVSDAPIIEAFRENKIVFSEPLPVEYLEDIFQAEAALEQSLALGLFVAGKKIRIDYHHHASTPAELQAHWEAIEPYSDTPKDKIIAAREEELFAQLEAFIQTSAKGINVTIRENAYVSNYFPVKD